MTNPGQDWCLNCGDQKGKLMMSRYVCICVGNVFNNAGGNLGAKKVGECMEERGHGG